MKVLFISSWYPNSTNVLKGIFVKKHAAAIKQAGIEIEVLALTINYSKSLFEKKTYEVIDENGIKTHMIEVNSRFYKLLYLNLPFQFGLLRKEYYKKIRKTFSPDLIHSNVLFPAAILGYWLSLKEKLPHVITEHWSKVDKFMGKSLYSKAGKKAYNEAKKVTTVSSFLKNSIGKHITDRNKIEIIPNVINTDLFCYKEKIRNTDTIVFTCVAHWSTPKRPDLIFNALQSVASKTEKEVVLNVIGEGPLMNVLKSTSWTFNVNYLGNKPPAELAAILQKSYYFLHASDIETFSIVIAEALATGTPVLASNVGAIPELINEENGIIVNNLQEEWAEAIIKLITIKNFDYSKISSGVQKFSMTRVGEKFKEIYLSSNTL